MVGNEQENTEKVEKLKKKLRKKKQEGSERIGEVNKKKAVKYYGYVEFFIAIFGVFSTLYYTFTIKSDVEIMNGKLKDRIDTKVEFKFDVLHDKISSLDKRFNTFEKKINVLISVLNRVNQTRLIDPTLAA
ncbi:hypothetical protein C1646_820944 [Rhizophagus diaphanus]|nr:hypothetical protein C1646_820944 [Rhizophagus diaphanus] [Rhizophagus sp. MUCL 43196]